MNVLDELQSALHDARSRGTVKIIGSTIHIGRFSILVREPRSYAYVKGCDVRLQRPPLAYPATVNDL